jgi:hypothetical protein
MALTLGSAGKRVQAHKFILLARSPHFRAMFTTGMRESHESEITIPNCSLPTFLLILRFLYAGTHTLPLLLLLMSPPPLSLSIAFNERLGDVAAVNEVNAVEVLEAANFFKCDRLKAVCEEILHRHLDIDNAASLLQIADRFDARQLKSCCLEFTIKNFSEVSKTVRRVYLRSFPLRSLADVAAARLLRAGPRPDDLHHAGGGQAPCPDPGHDTVTAAIHPPITL